MLGDIQIATSNSFDNLNELNNIFNNSLSEKFVFNHPVWQKTWWECFNTNSNNDLLMISMRDRSNNWFFAPMYKSQDTIHFIGSEDLTDYHDFLYSTTELLDFVVHMIMYLKKTYPNMQVILSSLRNDSTTLNAVIKAAELAGVTLEKDYENVAPRIKLASTWEDYLYSLSKKHRHELRRKLRRLKNAGSVDFIELSDTDQIAHSMTDFIRLHKMSSSNKEQFMTLIRENFFKKIAVAMANEGITRLCFMKFEGKIVATSLCFVLNDTKYLYNSGYDPEYGHLSVGILNHVKNIHACIKEGISIFDFLKGNERYKYEIGGVDRQLVRLKLYL